MSLGLLTRGYVCPGGTGVSAGPPPEIINVEDLSPRIETTALAPVIICPPECTCESCENCE
jgi:hypothetical protein